MSESNAEFKPIERVIKSNLAVLRENSGTGWKRLVTVTQWGGGKFKLDIRDWNADMTKATKGMTFARSEVEKLKNILAILDLNVIDEYSPSENAVPVKKEQKQEEVKPQTPVTQEIEKSEKDLTEPDQAELDQAV